MRVLVKHQLELVQPQDPRREAIFSSGQKEEKRYRENCMKTIIVSTYVCAFVANEWVSFGFCNHGGRLQHKRTHFKDIE